MTIDSNDYAKSQAHMQRIQRQQNQEALAIHNTQERLIPTETAYALCQQIQQDNRSPLKKLQCWRCVQQGKEGLPAKLVTSHPGYCGCSQVNKRYMG